MSRASAQADAGAWRRLSVLVGDDQPIALVGMVQVLQQHGIAVVGTVSAGRDLLEAVRATTPDVVIVDPAMAERGDTLAAIATIQARHTRTAVLAVLGDASAASVEAALDSGCAGVVPRTSSVDAVLAAVREVAAGERHLHPRAIASLLHQRQASEVARAARVLTSRELAVLRRVAEGRTNAEIGADLGVAEATVKTHLAHVLRKLDAADRAHAVSRALRLGLFT